MEEDRDVPLLLGRPFLATGRALIDIQKDQLVLRLSEEHDTFDIFKAIKYPIESDSCFKIDVVDNVVYDNYQLKNPSDPLKACIVHSQSTHTDSSEIEMCARYLAAASKNRAQIVTISSLLCLLRRIIYSACDNC
ncbi:Uncharacterized protein Adt_23780 [Abeliophyllum distichum]|uniref:Reverse transcriptase domain-containing protein n=1 Tax=Abeliophyllum distichum TaxID=126358 RepID=A0ABD1SC24_9LAMI